MHFKTYRISLKKRERKKQKKNMRKKSTNTNMHGVSELMMVRFLREISSQWVSTKSNSNE